MIIGELRRGLLMKMEPDAAGINSEQGDGLHRLFNHVYELRREIANSGFESAKDVRAR